MTEAERTLGFRVDGITINTPTMDDAVSSIISAAEQGQSFSVCTLNLDHVVQLKARRDFRQAYQRARFVTADGFPIVVLGWLAKTPLQRTTGADLVLPICQQASQRDLPIFLFGSNDATLSKAKDHLTERFPGLSVTGTFSPGPQFDPYSAEADQAIERIRSSGARLCFVALGAPRQEIFSARCLDLLPGVGFLCIGAALDFIAGTQTRAPRFAQKSGLEWFWRASRNPRRLAPRYAKCMAILPGLLAKSVPQIFDAHMGKARWRS